MLKKLIYILTVFIFLLSGCKNKTETQTIPEIITPEPEPIVTETPEPEPGPIVVIPPEQVPAVTEAPKPEHSELYIPDVSTEDMITYFNEVVLDSEFITDGDPSFVQKWDIPIYFFIDGTPTPEDLDTLHFFADWLNSIDGFPGIYETKEHYHCNLQIHFCSPDEFLTILGDTYTNMDGAVHFWYEENAIYDATICIRNDIDQYLRNSVILEELYNGLGPVQDTTLRPDSLIYQEFSQPQELTPVDEVILKLLYHPNILCGMDKEACANVIRELYY